MQKLTKIRLFLLFILPTSLFFSYYPLFSLASLETLNLELSIPLILLFLFALLSIPSVFTFLKNLPKTVKNRNFCLLFTLLFVIYVAISLFWTKNLLRGILTTGITSCLFISVISIYELLKSKKCCKNYNISLLRFYLCSTSVICVFCWIQCILDVAGVPRENTLLCLGCTSATFGFPHPSGFAIEPQFMGNLLLLPSLLLPYYLLKPEKSPFSRKITLSLAVIIIFTLFLTFSRGAIYSFVLAFVILLCLEFKRKTLLLTPIFVTIIAFLLSLASQGLMSELSPYNGSFFSGVAKSIDQLSLGIIDFTTSSKPVENSQQSSQQPSQQSPQQPSQRPSSEAKTEKDPIFDGYVEESTNTRLMLSSLAIKSWTNSPASFIFGYGIGSSGVVINKFFPDAVDSKEIIQNEALTIALELGLVGVILVIISLFFALKKLYVSPDSSIFISVLIAFFISLMFFSGLPNALHVYLLPPLIYLLFQQKLTDRKQNM